MKINVKYKLRQKLSIMQIIKDFILKRKNTPNYNLQNENYTNLKRNVHF
jgi:hypothetical protein